MNEDKTPQTPQTVTPESKPETVATVEKKSGWLSLAALILAVGAWVTLAYSTGYAAVVVALLAVLAGAFACRRPAGPWRNTAITAIMAAAVLIIVVLAFIIVLKIGLAK